MSKFKEDDGVIFVSLRDGMSRWLRNRIAVVQTVVHGIGPYGQSEISYYLVDSDGSLLLGYEDELESYP